MSFWKKILAARNAINYGEQLSDSATWKKSAVAVSAIAGLLAAIFPFIPHLDQVDEQTIKSVAGGVYAVYSIFIMYTHAATTTTIGLSPKR